MPAVEKAGKGPRVSGYLPAILALLVFYLHIYFGLAHFEQRQKDFQLQEFSQESTNLLEQMSLYADPEYFRATRLTTCFKNSSDYQTFLNSLRQNQKVTGDKFSCLIWNADGRVVFDDHFQPRVVKESELEKLHQDLGILNTQGEKSTGYSILRMRRLLGPHLDASRLAAAVYLRYPIFVRPDSAGRFADFWIGWGEKFASIVFFKRETMNSDIGLTQFCEEFSRNDLQISFISAGNGNTWSHEHQARTRELAARLEVEGKSAAIFQQTMVAGKRIAGNKMLLASRQCRQLLNPGKLTLLSALISLFALVMLLKSSNAGFRIDRCSVKLQLILMLLVTTGLPLFSLMMVTSDHVARKKAALIKNAYQTCIGYIQHVDRRSLTNHAHLINLVNKSIVAMKTALPLKFAEKALFEKLTGPMDDLFLDVRLIASSSPDVRNLSGVFKDGKFIPFDRTFRQKSFTAVELKMFRDVATYFLSVINNQPVELEKFVETEMIAEMVYQRPFHEIIQNMMLATDKIWNLGWGSESGPVLIKLLSLKDKLITDYFFMLMFRNGPINRDFMARQIFNLERNELGLKFLYASSLFFSKDSLIIAENPWFREIFSKTREHPAVEPCFTVMDGKEYVFAGMRSQNLDKYSLYAFYPLDKIDAQIAEERRVLMSAGIITIILLIGLSIVFSSSIVLPLAALKAGAIAIRQKDFSFRFSGLANDEFGEMARIFNNSIADFEELSLAGIVQARLLPRHEIPDSRFDLFGKSIPMTELGGDYFDYFQVDNNNYVVMAGDVAGHGVGASLIMAMAKAGVMQCHDCLADPAEVLARLHQIIHETRSKVQRKVMTFQYLYFNADSGAGLYANAGACSPILVDRENNVTSEIALSGPVLGGFKKSKFANLGLNIAPGQALVFYTDGIIEAMNPEGREIGYEGFKQLLLECHDADVRTYYDNIFRRYMQWLGGQQPQDDLTIIILSRRATL